MEKDNKKLCSALCGDGTPCLNKAQPITKLCQKHHLKLLGQGEKPKIKILYTNYRGETRVRKIIPKELKFLSTEWHPEEQWCLLAFDVEKNAERTFACKDIQSWKVD